MTGVLAAGGLLEGLARGTAALPPSSPPLQALCHLLTQACSASQAAIDQAKQAVHDSEADAQSHDGLSELEGWCVWRNAAAFACCQTWQVSRSPCNKPLASNLST